VETSRTLNVATLLERAKEGDPEAQFDLGNDYLNGWGVEIDPKRAAKWFTKAAGNGYAPGQYHLGELYSKGDGVAQNYQEALRWFSAAAEQK